MKKTITSMVEQEEEHIIPTLANLKEVVVKFKTLVNDAVIPSYAHDGDVGMDMTAVDVEYDPEHDQYVYLTGLSCELPEGYGMFLFPRSSNCKTEAYLTNHVGIVDSGYRGEIQFRYKNRKPYRKSLLEWLAGNIDPDRALKFAPYEVGDRVGQMVILPYPKVTVEEVDELSDTERGTGGFGSTGK